MNDQTRVFAAGVLVCGVMISIPFIVTSEQEFDSVPFEGAMPTPAIQVESPVIEGPREAVKLPLPKVHVPTTTEVLLSGYFGDKWETHKEVLEERLDLSKSLEENGFVPFSEDTIASVLKSSEEATANLLMNKYPLGTNASSELKEEQKAVAQSAAELAQRIYENKFMVGDYEKYPLAYMTTFDKSSDAVRMVCSTKGWTVDMSIERGYDYELDFYIDHLKTLQDISQ